LADRSITAVDGPFTEAKELVGGYAVIEVRSKVEAVELARRLMQIHRDHWPGWEGSCEVRQLGDSRPNPILMLINGCDIRIIHATTGELIRNPSRRLPSLRRTQTPTKPDIEVRVFPKSCDITTFHARRLSAP
jgi:hypothetical protein